MSSARPEKNESSMSFSNRLVSTGSPLRGNWTRVSEAQCQDAPSAAAPVATVRRSKMCGTADAQEADWLDDRVRV